MPEENAAPIAGPKVESQIEAFTQRLSIDVRALDFFVTRGDAKAVLEQMQALAPSDFHAVLQSLGGSGHLETLLEKLSWADQCRFLELAVDQGCIGEWPGDPGTGPLEPPGQPALYAMRSELPRCVNDLIHEHSKAQVAQFNRDYAAYAGRYEAAVGACQTLREIQQLGRPASTGIVWEHVDRSDPHARAYDIDWNRFTQASEVGPLIAVSDRMAELRGERRDGSAWFEVKLETVIAGRVLELKADSGTGIVKPRFGVTATHALLPGVKGRAKVMSDGEVELAVGVKDGPFTFEAMRGEGRGSIQLGPLKTGVSPDTAWVEVRAIAGLQGELGSRVSASPRAGELRVGLKGSLKAEGLEAKLQASMAVRGLSQQTVARALDSSDLFSPPPELTQGTPWSLLSLARRAGLQTFGWSEDDWQAALGHSR